MVEKKWLIMLFQTEVNASRLVDQRNQESSKSRGDKIELYKDIRYYYRSADRTEDKDCMREFKS